MIVLGNGDILAGGDTGVARLLPTGSLDPTSGSGGRAPAGFPGGPVSAPNLTVQPDGKIVADGSIGTEGRNGHSNVALVRFNPDGTLDTSFGTGGTLTGGPGAAQALGLDAAGDIFTLDTANLPGEAEFSPAGVPDARVTAAPITASTPSHEGAGNGVSEAFAFLPTGQTLVGGLVGGTAEDDTDAQVQRLNADGTVDPAFASPQIDFNGIEGVRGASAVASLAVQPDGKILTGGNIGLARVNADGTLDTAFGTGGAEPRVTTTLPVLLSTSALLAVLPNGDFLAIGAGTNPTTGSTELILTRYFQ